MAEQAKKSDFLGFPPVYWITILFEFMERGAYYGVMSVLSVYLVMKTGEGGLGFSKQSVGLIKSTIQPLLYGLPIISGAIADRFGYRRTLMVAFSLLGLGYFLTSQAKTYPLVFMSLVVMGFGAGTFKPIISGTIARVTSRENSTLGFGIFYWTINLGAFLFPLFLVPYLKSLSWSYVFIASAIATGILILPNLLLYREPPRPVSTKSLGEVLTEALLVLKDFRFILMILIYSGFWILYFQMFDTVLWYLKDHMDMGPVNAFINSLLDHLGPHRPFVFDAEHVTVVNAGTIIALQILVSSIVKHTRALPTMIAGIALGTAGMALLSLSSYCWVFIAGIILFSLGEMTAHPKYISYVGEIAPRDKVATYMGYCFLYGVIGSGIGGILGASSYVYFVDKLHKPQTLWLFFSLIGLATIIGLILYNIYLAPRGKPQQVPPEA
ncbi:MAG: MFS transporter [Candidatus Eremiobacteraeota bacterium]|nr:MFS transporter [Candidatus Eremiobacteraeota bacterium]